MSTITSRVCGAVEVSASVIIVETTDDSFQAFTLMQTLARMGHLPHHWGLATGLTRMRAVEEPPYWKVEAKGAEFQLDPVSFLQMWSADEDTAKASATMACGTCSRPWPSKETGSCHTAGCKGMAMKRSVPIILTGIHHFLEGEKMEPAILELLRVCAQTVQDPNHGKANRRPVIMLVPPGTKLPDSLTRLGIRIEEPLPSRDTIRKEVVPNFVSEAGASPRWKPFIQTLNEGFPAAATDQLAGLSRPEIRTALKMALVTGRDAVAEGQGDFQGAVVNVLGDKKRETLRAAHGLELMDPVDPASCGGMPLLRSWISGRVGAFSQKARDAKIPQPKSVALLGPPGVGKSLAAKIVGSILTWPTVKLDIGSMFGSLVGESESNMRHTLQIIEAVAPCVLLCDEVDKAFGGVLSANDSGTSQRLFGAFLTWIDNVEYVG